MDNKITVGLLEEHKDVSNQGSWNKSLISFLEGTGKGGQNA